MFHLGLPGTCLYKSNSNTHLSGSGGAGARKVNFPGLYKETFLKSKINMQFMAYGVHLCKSCCLIEQTQVGTSRILPPIGSIFAPPQHNICCVGALVVRSRWRTQ